MPIDEGIFGILNDFSAAFVFKAFFLLFLIFYTFFALILYRQVQLMSRTLPTVISPFLLFIAILHIGVSLALLFIVIGAF